MLLLLGCGAGCCAGCRAGSGSGGVDAEGAQGGYGGEEIYGRHAEHDVVAGGGDADDHEGAGGAVEGGEDGDGEVLWVEGDKAEGGGLDQKGEGGAVPSAVRQRTGEFLQVV